MQGARFESGQDNSPEFDLPDTVFNQTSHQMGLYVASMSGLLLMEMEALADLAVSVFDPPRTADRDMLLQRVAELRGLVQTHLWDEEIQAYANKLSSNDTFYPRISPTTFYPLLGRAASDDQAAALVTHWLTNSSRFCIAKTGDMAGNSDDCWWGLPSINAADPAFPPLGYWLEGNLALHSTAIHRCNSNFSS